MLPDEIASKSMLLLCRIREILDIKKNIIPISCC